MNDIERALVASWSPETLAVYADALQMDGDPRGELIAIELRLAETLRPELAVRREALLQKWLGFVPGPRDGIRARFGFLEVSAPALVRVLATPPSQFVRSIFIEGTNIECTAGLRAIAATPRPWLTRLTLAPRRRSERRTNVLVEAQLAADVVGATENLEFLDVTGKQVFAAFAHPSVRRLRLIGHDAIEALVEAGPALPNARELFFAFSDHPYGRVGFGPAGLPRTLLSAATLPALASLDVSPNELQRSWDMGQVAVFELLSELGVAPQLRELAVPGVRTPTERDQLQHAIAMMPALETLSISPSLAELVGGLRHPCAQIETSNLPGPIHDLVEPVTLGLRIENHATDHRLSMRRIGELVQRCWSQLAVDVRAAWTQLWPVFDGAPLVDEWAAQPAAPRRFDAAPARRALLGLGDALDEDPRWRTFAEELASTREKVVLIRRLAY